MRRQGSQYIDEDNVVFRRMTIEISNAVSINFSRIAHKGRIKKLSIYDADFSDSAGAEFVEGRMTKFNI
jgi:predicted DNA-binding WGR domain protein